MDFIDEIYSPAEAKTLKRLWEGDKTDRVLKEVLGKKLLESKNVTSTFNLGLDQLVLILSNADFDHTETEAVNVATFIVQHRGDTNIPFYILDLLPKEVPTNQKRVKFLKILSKQQKLNLASSSMVYLGIFPGALRKRFESQGGPHDTFYRGVGIAAFEQVQMPEIAYNFIRWEECLQHYFGGSTAQFKAPFFSADPRYRKKYSPEEATKAEPKTDSKN